MYQFLKKLEMSRKVFHRVSFFSLVLICFGVSGCVTQSAVQIQQAFEATDQYKIRIESCVNRTEYHGSHDLEGEATRVLTDKVKESGLFEVTPDAQLVMTCDIERFAEGSATKRWIMPGWGATQAEVVVMVWDKKDEKVLATFRNEAAVKAGGFYTIGADQYIFGAAFDDVLKQIRAWMLGSKTGKPGEPVK